MATLPLYDPLAEQIVTRQQINAERDAREIAPVEVGGRIYDCDPRSDMRFQQSIDLWDALGVEAIDWTCADNTVIALDLDQLTAVYEGIKVARGLRSLQLHQAAAILKARLPDVTMRDVVESLGTV